MDARFKRQDPRSAFVEAEEIDAAPGTENNLAYVAREVHRAYARALQTRITNHGVSMGQWYFLRALWMEDGLTQRELSQRVGMMEPTTVTALNNMERCGLVERVRNIHDRRKVNIFLTPKGKALRDDILPCADEIAELAIRGIPQKDVVAAVGVLRRVSANLGSLPFMDADDDLA